MTRYHFCLFNFFFSGYGLTETSPVVSMVSMKLFEQGKATGSIGQLIPNTVAKIIAVNDSTGKCTINSVLEGWALKTISIIKIRNRGQEYWQVPVHLLHEV